MAGVAAADPGGRLKQLRHGPLEPGVHVYPAYSRRGIDGALPDVWLREETAGRLSEAAQQLRKEKLALLVLDGWRPRSLQTTLWERYRARLAKETGLSGEALDRRASEFVTPPKGSDVPPPHSTGGAVDVTICTLDGQPLDMGGDFDELTDRSHPDHYERDDLTDEERIYRDRRRLLHSAMSSAGFWRLPTEWWHFEYGTASWAGALGADPLYGEAAPPRRSIGEAWRDLAYGRSRLADESLRERDPAGAAELEANERAVGRALRNLIASAVLVALATLLAIIFAGDAIQNLVLGLGIAVVTLTGTTWWAARGAREADTQRVLALSAIFMQNPGELRRLMQTDRLHRVVQNLLKTVLPTDDLGDSLWKQGVSPLVQRLRENRYRRDQLYEIHLRERLAPLELPLPDGAPIQIAPGEWREIRAELSYSRPFTTDFEGLWVGLVFDPRGGPKWFRDPNFVYREYMPLDPTLIETICGAFPGRRVLQERRWRRRGSGKRTASSAHPTWNERLRFAERLCRPTLTIGTTALSIVDVAIDERGMGMQFGLPPDLRRRLSTDPWAQVSAGLSFPLHRRICAFPVYFPDLTLEGRIVFEHGDADVTDVTTDLFFSVHQPFSIDPVEVHPNRLEVPTRPGNWIFPGAGMVFSWRDGSSVRGGTRPASMFPRP
jgi:zinc D-Ala-D-Ala dipeptidase